MPLLIMMGVKVHEWPSYVSNIVFELWQRGSDNGSQARPQHYVKVLHNQQYLPSLPGSSTGTSSKFLPCVLAFRHSAAFVLFLRTLNADH